MSLGCGPYGKEALVSKNANYMAVADLKGVKIRSPEGLAADVFRSLQALLRLHFLFQKFIHH